MKIMYMPDKACRFKVTLVNSSEFSNTGNDFLLQFELIHKMFLLLKFTKLLDLPHIVELIVGNQNNKSMMNFEFHLPDLSMDPD